MDRLRYAVIPTHNRPKDFQDCVDAIAPQVDSIIAVAHEAAYVESVLEDLEPPWCVCWYRAEIPNLSTMWNLGLDTAAAYAQGRPYDVAVLNDDAIVSPDWFDRVQESMRHAAAGCVRRVHDGRMAGHAFILDGTKGLRADEQFRWWYGDDDLQRQAERAGGVAFANGPDVEHRYPNSTTTGILADIATEDGKRYREKWFK